MIRWGDAIRDPQQLKRAGIEVGQKAVVVGGAAATAVAIGKLGSKTIPKG
jgi:putative N-acetylmannosamine-6-phosphate epimerase